MGRPLDEVMGLDADEKLNYLVAKTYDIDNRLDVIENNHLQHMQKDIDRIGKVIWTVAIMVLGQVLWTITRVLMG